MVSYGAELPQASVQSDVALADESLVAAASGARIKVASVFVMSAVGGVVTFEEGTTTRKFEVYPGANGGVAISAPDGQFLFRLDVGEALTVTSDIVGAHFVSVLYIVE